jgi:hypothetical protein
MILQIVLSLLLGCLVYQFWFAYLNLYTTIKYKDEYKKAALAVIRKQSYKGKQFSSVQVGLSMSAHKGRLVECSPVFMLKVHELYYLGKWWKL